MICNNYCCIFIVFFFNDTATTEIYTLSLHDALPIFEAQACGTPVIAFGKGGALETIENGRTGIFFDTQTSESIIEAVNKFESSNDFDPYYIRRNAERFSPERFRNEFQAIVDTEIKNYFGEASTNSILNQLNVESDIDTSRKESVIFNSEHEHVA